jgi:signal transduction histidine kinase
MNKIIHILHLEDDVADMELVQATLESAGIVCQINCVQTREEFSETVSKGGYDVILADYGLPMYDGMSALQLVKELQLDVPFIFVSGTMGEDAAIEGLTKGATDYVLKQKLSRLVPAIKRALTEAENKRERKRAEEELRIYHEHLEDMVKERTVKLEEANKELEAFSYSVSHDLRAPLRTITGFGNALLEDCEDKLDSNGRNYLHRIIAATGNMALLIEDMLNLSRITRTEMDIVPVNLSSLAKSIKDESQRSQPERLVNFIIAGNMEDSADPGLIRIVLENLLGNAWKFTGKKPEAKIEFGVIKEEGENVYFVRDNGAGFDMVYLDKLFAPFQRLHTTEEYPGTGIGLAIVKRIITRHGGKVWAEGKVDGGATFYFSLPQSSEKAGDYANLQ